MSSGSNLFRFWLVHYGPRSKFPDEGNAETDAACAQPMGEPIELAGKKVKLYRTPDPCDWREAKAAIFGLEPMLDAELKSVTCPFAKQYEAEFALMTLTFLENREQARIARIQAMANRLQQQKREREAAASGSPPPTQPHRPVERTLTYDDTVPADIEIVEMPERAQPAPAEK